MTDHTRTEKIGDDSINFCGRSSQAKNRYDTLQIGLDDANKEQFWEDLDEVVQGIPIEEKIFY